MNSFPRSAAVVSVFLFAFLLVPVLLAGQPSYQPRDTWPGVVYTDTGAEISPATELLAIMFGQSGCSGNAVEGFDDAIRGMKDALAARADSLGYSFAAIGVATDWDVIAGVQYLLEGKSVQGDLNFGPWAEIVVGRSYTDAASSHFLIPRGLPMGTPQVFVFTRRLEISEEYPVIRADPPELLMEVTGGDGLVEWAAAGWQIPGLNAVE